MDFFFFCIFCLQEKFLNCIEKNMLVFPVLKFMKERKKKNKKNPRSYFLLYLCLNLYLISCCRVHSMCIGLGGVLP